MTVGETGVDEMGVGETGVGEMGVIHINGIRYFPNFGSVRTINFTCDVYTNDSLHGVCFPTVISNELNFSEVPEGMSRSGSLAKFT